MLKNSVISIYPFRLRAVHPSTSTAKIVLKTSTTDGTTRPLVMAGSAIFSVQSQDKSAITLNLTICAIGVWHICHCYGDKVLYLHCFICKYVRIFKFFGNFSKKIFLFELLALY